MSDGTPGNRIVFYMIAFTLGFQPGAIFFMGYREKCQVFLGAL